MFITNKRRKIIERFNSYLCKFVQSYADKNMEETKYCMGLIHGILDIILQFDYNLWSYLDKQWSNAYDLTFGKPNK